MVKCDKKKIPVKYLPKKTIYRKRQPTWVITVLNVFNLVVESSVLIPESDGTKHRRHVYMVSSECNRTELKKMH